MSDVESEASDACAADNSTTYTQLRIASIFIILVTSLIGSILPVATRKLSWIPRPVFEFTKFFGSGVIIATAFIHLLAPAFEALGSECLSGAWTDYSWAPAIAMIAVYFIFFAEIATYRFGTARLSKFGITYHTHNDAEAEHGHAHSHVDENTPDLMLPVPAPAPASTQAGPVVVEEGLITPDKLEKGQSSSASESASASSIDSDPRTRTDLIEYDVTTSEGFGQLIAVAVLEFGVMLHSIIIGLTVAVNSEFITLFVVIVFHQMFEGLGLGSRLSQLQLPHKFKYAPYIAAVVYSICTPLGIAIGLGIRESYNGNGATANAVSGVLDAFSAGILLYTGLVELLGHEILLNPRMMKAGNGKLAYVFCCMMLGSGLMALLGRWA